MGYKVHKTTKPYLKRVRSHKKPYTTDVLGKKVIVHPQVMSPKYDWSSRFYIRNMPDQSGKEFLEIGCGSGVISLFAALHGAKRLVAVDINPHAIKNTKANFKKYGINNADVFLSDVFAKVTGRFDTVLFNAPYHGNEPQDALEYGVSDPGYRALRQFLTQAARYLKPNGQIILGFSNTGDLELLNTLLIESYLYVEDFKQEEHNDWMCYMFVIRPIVFKNKRQAGFYDSDYDWFLQYKQQIRTGKVLKVGYGLGYVSYFISLINKNITSLDVVLNPDSLNGSRVVLYDGVRFPFASNQFDTVICTFTLHHTSSPEQLFSEIQRVSKSKVIVIEESYTSLAQKIQLVLSCWYANLMARQKVNIHWNSYMTPKRLLRLFKKHKLKITRRQIEPRRTYKVELIIGQKIKAS